MLSLAKRRCLFLSTCTDAWKKSSGMKSWSSSKSMPAGSVGHNFCRWRLAALARYSGLERAGIGSWDVAAPSSSRILLTISAADVNISVVAVSLTAAFILVAVAVPSSGRWRCCWGPLTKVVPICLTVARYHRFLFLTLHVQSVEFDIYTSLCMRNQSCPPTSLCLSVILS